MQKKQALGVRHDQLAHHADPLEQQRQFLDQHTMASSNTFIAGQLRCQRTELEQRYLPAIQALEQQRDF